MTQGTRKRKPRKVRKPDRDFPLWPHPSGRWCRKIKQRFHYFGKVTDDPEGQKALDLWLKQKDDLLAGRVPRITPVAGVTIRDLCNTFCTHKKSLLTAGEITDWTFNEYYATCERLCRTFGKDRLADDVVADDFRQLRENIAKAWGPVRLGNEIGRVKGVFKFGYESGLLDKPPRYGPQFKKRDS